MAYNARMTPRPTPPRFARLALFTALALAALFGIAWAALTILFPPARVKSLVESQLHRALARDVRFEGASLGLFPPVRLTVRHPEMSEPGGFARGVACSADAVDLDLDVSALLGRRIKVERLAIEKPALHLLLRTDGSTNLDSLAAPQPAGAASSPAMDLDVRTFAIRGGRVLVDDVPAGRRIAFGLATTTSLTALEGGTRIATAGATDVSDLAFGPLTATRVSDLDASLSKLVLHAEHAGAYDAKGNRLAL